MINAGRMNRLINIRLNVTATSRSTDGAVVYTETTIHAGRWAEKRPVNGKEFWAMNERYSEAAVAFTMRYSSQVTVKCFINSESEDYDIKNIIDPYDRHEDLIIVAEKIE